MDPVYRVLNNNNRCYGETKVILEAIEIAMRASRSCDWLRITQFDRDTGYKLRNVGTYRYGNYASLPITTPSSRPRFTNKSYEFRPE